MNKSFLKSLLVVAVIALGLSIQSCSNPFNPASKFVGKWRVVSQTYRNGKDVPMSDAYRYLEAEFLGDFKTVVVKDGLNSTSYPWEVREGGVFVLGHGGYGGTFHYSFSGNRLTIKEVSNLAGMVLERE